MPGNGSVLGNRALGESSIKVLTSRGIIDIIPDGPPSQEGKKLKYTGTKPGTKDQIIAIGHKIK